MSTYFVFWSGVMAAFAALIWYYARRIVASLRGIEVALGNAVTKLAAK